MQNSAQRPLSAQRKNGTEKKGKWEGKKGKQESHAVARKPRNVAAVVFVLKLADKIHYKFKSRQHRRRLHGGDGGDRPHGQTVVGAMPPSRPHKNFDRLISKVHSFNCYIGYDRILTACPE